MKFDRVYIMNKQHTRSVVFKFMHYQFDEIFDERQIIYTQSLMSLVMSNVVCQLQKLLCCDILH